MKNRIPHTVYWNVCWAIGGWNSAIGEPVTGYSAQLRFRGEVAPDVILRGIPNRYLRTWFRQYGAGCLVVLDDQGRRWDPESRLVAETPPLPSRPDAASR
jgi:hypothetical protein